MSKFCTCYLLKTIKKILLPVFLTSITRKRQGSGNSSLELAIA